MSVSVLTFFFFFFPLTIVDVYEYPSTAALRREEAADGWVSARSYTDEEEKRGEENNSIEERLLRGGSEEDVPWVGRHSKSGPTLYPSMWLSGGVLTVHRLEKCLN